ncbi:MAG: bifunctional imidazole glycerol-phosphate dehydratase/histidinol phosphatase [Lysobacteraceae bacterium SCN 69-123]|jgi:imidazoleglycerol-phosphate dehydratase/histidinol-phosphatase|uniref:bifunctional histidinol-phosphatase/imidazoleglycerol-phosphate dehydratase HisB n=1 Tax=Stenotrophomonas acidaminiphila TaxID=128780 RepID=UPI00086951D2|nr:bifunctional histidinol-phosphatase/imidazoleglycerol-phosphate dehydratase HisB [Stenotrophomonas acidaminiphila]MBN8801228.1 bifunctional histidinol-phosphatase/imidazoleglycerol-phosphate dehydratase HisB [Stenotrophomonas acidaminiphila]MDF9440176.1 bifunctional histidinol-phosphatase/imidazoleglycerol-phosphate dehydratase HisB [Stenotrophomonas acidaminiphila]ODU45935.1 MAG: bifunctional imidazole glycerol-phosphate dehydratase/histidinol phosphatase [Xanthomonadaceae bacterium SCN 69-1
MTPILFVDRDGTLIEEPADFQIDAYEKIRFVRNVIPAMLRLRDAGYQFVIVSNQDGLGSDSYPQASFDGPNDLMLQIFASQGIVFREVLIDPSWPADNSPNRKPGIGMMLPYLQDRSIDWARSAVVGDRPTDIQFAENLRIRGFQLRTAQFGGQWDWDGIAHELADAPRRAVVQRDTRETQIRVAVDLDRAAASQVDTGLPFFDHMLDQIGRHGGFALEVQARGDLHIDEHHTIEDTGLALGQALREALGDKRGIGRYGFTLPMDETLASAALDFSGRPYFVFEGVFKRERVGDMPTELVPHFFRSLCDAAGLNLNLKVEGDNDHHKIEACFKALARALRQAIRREGTELPSTKGAL